MCVSVFCFFYLCVCIHAVLYGYVFAFESVCQFLLFSLVPQRNFKANCQALLAGVRGVTSAYFPCLFQGPRGAGCPSTWDQYSRPHGDPPAALRISTRAAQLPFFFISVLIFTGSSTIFCVKKVNIGIC